MTTKKRISPIAAMALLCVGVMMVLPAGRALANLGADHFPNIVLTTQDGKKVHFRDLIKGKTVAINFIYTNCHFSCPLETARMAQVQKLLGERVGKDVFFYSITIDPGRDTPAQLKAYAKRFHTGPGWTFLTGKKEDIDLLAVKLGMTDDPSITSGPGANIDGHTPHLLIGNEANGQWVRDSSTDNPHVLANMLTGFIDPGKSLPVAHGHGEGGAPIRINDAGQYLFAKACGPCHTIGHGDGIGPDLFGVTRIRDGAWLAHYIAEPDKVLAAGDPIAKALYAKYKVAMPNLRLGQIDISALMNFLSAEDRRVDRQASVGNRDRAARTGPETTSR